MSISFSKSFRKTADGAVWGFLAEALMLPTGLITTGYLTRNLGPEGYGIFTLAATLVGWVTFSTTSLFSRTTIKFVSEANDWRPVGTTVLRLNLACGVGAMLLLWFAAEPISMLLGEPKLKIYLQIFSLEPLFFILARAHRFILIGTGNFRKQSIPSAVRWLARAVLIILLVESGLSIPGAILGSVAAAILELAIYRFYVRPPLFFPSSFPAKQLWNYATPLFLSALSMQLFSKIDLFSLTALGGTATEAGIYGAAQSLCIVPGLFALSFSPLLLSTLGHMLKNGQDQAAQEMGSHSMRFIFGMLPFAAMASGAADEVVVLIFGSAFSPTAPLLSLLIFAKVAAVMISIASIIMIAVDKPTWTLVLSCPLPILAGVGHFLLIPHLGAIGAASVTTALSVLGALVAITSVYYVFGVFPPVGTLGRSLPLCGLAYVAAMMLPTPGFWVIPKLLAIIVMIPIGFGLLGEFSSREIEVLRSFLWRRALLKQN